MGSRYACERMTSACNLRVREGARAARTPVPPRVNGMLVAPNCAITLGVNTSTTYTGDFFAKESHAHAEYHRRV